jgi:LysR family transcriptional activator of dmlA
MGIIIESVVNKTLDCNEEAMAFVEVDAPIKTVSGQSMLATQGLGLINALCDNHDIKAYLAKGQLVPVLKDHWYQGVEIYVCYQQVKILQPKVRVFIDFFLSKRSMW